MNRNIQFWLAFSLVVAGVLLIVAAFCTPPLGEIHPSVLGALGELLAFSGSIIGIDYRYRSGGPRQEAKSPDGEEEE